MHLLKEKFQKNPVVIMGMVGMQFLYPMDRIRQGGKWMREKKEMRLLLEKESWTRLMNIC